MSANILLVLIASSIVAFVALTFLAIGIEKLYKKYWRK